MAATPTAVSLSRSEHPLWTPTLSLAREGMRPGAAGVSCALDEARASRSPGPGSYFPEIKRASGHLVGHPPSGRTVPPRAADDDKGPPSASRSFSGPTGASRLAQTHEICRNLRPICLAFSIDKRPGFAEISSPPGTSSALLAMQKVEGFESHEPLGQSSCKSSDMCAFDRREAQVETQATSDRAQTAPADTRG